MKKILFYGLMLLALVSCKKSSTNLDRESSTQEWNEVDLSLPNSKIIKAEVVDDKLYILHENGFVEISPDFTIVSNVNFGFSNPVMEDPRPVFSGNFFAFAKQSEDSAGINDVLVYNIYAPTKPALEMDTRIAGADLPMGCEVCAISSQKMILNFQDKVTQKNKLYAYQIKSTIISFDKIISATSDSDTLGYLKKLYSVNRNFFMSDNNQTVKMSNTYEFNNCFDGVIYDKPYEFKDSIYIATATDKYMSEDEGYTWKQNLKNIEMYIYPLKITYFELYYRKFEKDQLCDETDVVYKTYDLDTSIPFVPKNNNECYTVLGIMGSNLVTIKDNKLFYMEITE